MGASIRLTAAPPLLPPLPLRPRCSMGRSLTTHLQALRWVSQSFSRFPFHSSASRQATAIDAGTPTLLVPHSN